MNRDHERYWESKEQSFVDTICIEFQLILVYIASVTYMYDMLPKPNFKIHDSFDRNCYHNLGPFGHMIFLIPQDNHFCSTDDCSGACCRFGFRNHN